MNTLPFPKHDAAVVRETMKKQFEKIKDKFGTPRKSKIEPEEGGLQDMNLVRNSRSVVIVTRGGIIKRNECLLKHLKIKVVEYEERKERQISLQTTK